MIELLPEELARLEFDNNLASYARRTIHQRVKQKNKIQNRYFS